MSFVGYGVFLKQFFGGFIVFFAVLLSMVLQWFFRVFSWVWLILSLRATGCLFRRVLQGFLSSWELTAEVARG